MRSLHHSQRLAVAVPLSLMLVMVGVVGLGLAIRTGEGVPPVLDMRIAHIPIAAYRTHDPECPPYTHCPLESGVPPRVCHEVRIVSELPTAAQPSGRTARRLFVVPLQR